MEEQTREMRREGCAQQVHTVRNHARQTTLFYDKGVGWGSLSAYKSKETSMTDESDAMYGVCLDPDSKKQAVKTIYITIRKM